MVYNSLTGIQPQIVKTMSSSSYGSSTTTSSPFRASQHSGGIYNRKKRDEIEESETKILDSLSKGAPTNANGDKENFDRLAGFTLGLGSLYLQEMLSYPFVVVRRQCQVNHSALKYHVMPFTVFQVMLRLQRNQGFGSFWKGWGSTCIVQGIIIITEVVISETTQFPREITMKGNVGVKDIVGHEILKSLGMFITMPFYSASLVDSIQSQQMDQSRSSFSFFKDVFYRLAGWYMSQGHGRLLPMRYLIAPSLIHGMLHYTIKSFIEYIYNRCKPDTSPTADSPLDVGHSYYTQIMANFLSAAITDILLFPLETVVIRLHVQGTRTIIDDTDNGDGVVPLCTNYDGIIDCFRCIIREEGFSALYKGFGALLLQYILQYILVRVVKCVYGTKPSKVTKSV